MKEELKRFAKIAGKLLDAEKEEGVVAPVPYDELDKYLNLELSDEGISDDVFEEALTALVLRTPRTQTKSFFNQLFAGRRDKAYLGELLAVLLNNSMYTYKVGGPMIRVEKLILNKISELIGFEGDTEGTIAPGGSITNYQTYRHQESSCCLYI
jgi:glutamate/tyrosine decarboxylase-like PLP-dependent enzyme